MAVFHNCYLAYIFWKWKCRRTECSSPALLSQTELFEWAWWLNLAFKGEHTRPTVKTSKSRGVALLSCFPCAPRCFLIGAQQECPFISEPVPVVFILFTTCRQVGNIRTNLEPGQTQASTVTRCYREAVRWNFLSSVCARNVSPPSRSRISSEVFDVFNPNAV